MKVIWISETLPDPDYEILNISESLLQQITLQKEPIEYPTLAWREWKGLVKQADKIFIQLKTRKDTLFWGFCDSHASKFPDKFVWLNGAGEIFDPLVTDILRAKERGLHQEVSEEEAGEEVDG